MGIVVNDHAGGGNVIQHAGGDAGDAIQRCRKHGKWISHLPVRSRSRRVFDVQHLLSSTPGPGAMCCWALSFCKSCIHAELSVRNSCPIDRQTLEVKDLITNRSLAGVIDNLAVRCPTLSCSTGSTSAKRRKIRHSEENVCANGPVPCKGYRTTSKSVAGLRFDARTLAVRRSFFGRCCPLI